MFYFAFVKNIIQSDLINSSSCDIQCIRPKLKKCLKLLPQDIDSLYLSSPTESDPLPVTCVDSETCSPRMIWRCFICYIFVALTLKKLLGHINSMHSRSPDFRVVCGIDGCASEYRVFNSYYYHIKRTHAHLLQDEWAEEGLTLQGQPETREMMGTNNQTTANISAAEMVCATQEHSSVIQEGSTIIPQMVCHNSVCSGHVYLYRNHII